MTLAQNDVSATCERRKMTNDECRMTKEFQVPTVLRHFLLVATFAPIVRICEPK